MPAAPSQPLWPSSPTCASSPPTRAAPECRGGCRRRRRTPAEGEAEAARGALRDDPKRSSRALGSEDRPGPTRDTAPEAPPPTASSALPSASADFVRIVTRHGAEPLACGRSLAVGTDAPRSSAAAAPTVASVEDPAVHESSSSASPAPRRPASDSCSPAALGTASCPSASPSAASTAASSVETPSFARFSRADNAGGLRGSASSSS